MLAAAGRVQQRPCRGRRRAGSDLARAPGRRRRGRRRDGAIPLQLTTALHPIEDHELRREGWERADPITIEENVWLGAAVTVGPGVHIGRNSVVGAGSLVLRDIPDHVVAFGAPAAVVREIPRPAVRLARLCGDLRAPSPYTSERPQGLTTRVRHTL